MAENTTQIINDVSKIKDMADIKEIPTFRLAKKTKFWSRVLIFSALIFVAFWANNNLKNKLSFDEGFSNNKKSEAIDQSEKFLQKEGQEVYDRFYCNVYDGLVKDRAKNRYEMDEILKLAGHPVENNKLLDIGSGTGHHVADLNKRGFKAQGIDKSPHMIAKARKNYPRFEYIEGDVTQSMSFPSQDFTHITCLYFTVYNIKNKTVFFQNCHNWLAPGGILVLHLVDRDKFDPIVNTANPITILNVQNYSDKRITNSVVKFKGFTYKANFDQRAGDDVTYFDEHMKDDNSGKIRKNRHILYMEPKEKILEKAKRVGFSIANQSNMKKCHYDNQYLFFLQK
tara:strand:+ start:1527 stop:2546 length:1020 start_codon:yes stop_codon:yes gene_type:complete